MPLVADTAVEHSISRARPQSISCCNGPLKCFGLGTSFRRALLSSTDMGRGAVLPFKTRDFNVLPTKSANGESGIFRQEFFPVRRTTGSASSRMTADFVVAMFCACRSDLLASAFLVAIAFRLRERDSAKVFRRSFS